MGGLARSELGSQGDLVGEQPVLESAIGMRKEERAGGAYIVLWPLIGPGDGNTEFEVKGGSGDVSKTKGTPL